MIQYLVEHGHSWKDVQDYSLSQIGLFAREAGKIGEMERKERIMASWLGFNADKKGLEKLLKDSQYQKRSNDDVKSDWKNLAARLGSLKR